MNLSVYLANVRVNTNTTVDSQIEKSCQQNINKNQKRNLMNLSVYLANVRVRIGKKRRDYDEY